MNPVVHAGPHGPGRELESIRLHLVLSMIEWSLEESRSPEPMENRAQAQPSQHPEKALEPRIIEDHAAHVLPEILPTIARIARRIDTIDKVAEPTDKRPM